MAGVEGSGLHLFGIGRPNASPSQAQATQIGHFRINAAPTPSFVTNEQRGRISNVSGFRSTAN